MTMTILYVATKNAHKLREFQSMLNGTSFTLLPLPEDAPESPETGTTFASNAMEKAAFYSAYCDGWVLADDSGICVDYLGGAPGVLSARYAGPNSTDAELRRKLLDALSGVPIERRAAKMVSVVALWNNQSSVGLVARGEIDGHILLEETGDGGFGYDSLFWISSLGQSMGQLSSEAKNRISHRRRALDELMTAFERLGLP